MWAQRPDGVGCDVMRQTWLDGQRLDLGRSGSARVAGSDSAREGGADWDRQGQASVGAGYGSMGRGMADAAWLGRPGEIRRGKGGQGPACGDWEGLGIGKAWRGGLGVAVLGTI